MEEKKNQKPFELIPAGKEVCCSTPYDVVVKEGCTVKDVVDYLLTDKYYRTYEWGDVVIDINNEGRLASKYNSPYLSYSHGTITFNDIEQYYDRQIKSGYAKAGWYNTNLQLQLKD